MQAELKVAESMQNDVGRGIVRLDTRTRELLGISTGDIVQIKGKKKSVAIVWRAYGDDEGLGIIRMDGILRQNTDISLGENVKVKKAEAKDARKVVISPNQAIRFSAGFGDFIRRRLLGRPLIKGDKVVVGVLGTTLPFTITQVYPSGVVRVANSTQIVVKEEPVKSKPGIANIAYEDIGGLKEETQKIREMIELPMKHPELFERLGIDPPNGVLLHGPPGTGKTLIAKAVANETNAFFIPLNGPEIMSKFYGESEENLRKVFKEAEENAPSIIFIDELDAIAAKREEVHGEVERRVVAQLLSLMDGLKSRGKVVVIGATNRPDALDPALRRPGRFDREIVIGVPDRNARKEILQIHTRGMPLAEDVNLDEFADITHGFVGADLEALSKESAMNSLRKILPQIDLEEDIIPPEILEKLEVNREDFKGAWKSIEPSALREVYVEIPNVSWNDIGGLRNIKTRLKEAVEWPLVYPEAFSSIGIKPPKGGSALRPPWHRKDPPGQGRSQRERGQLYKRQGPRVPEQVGGGEREGSERDVQEGQTGRTHCYLPGRD